jgi:hypothetical protein
VLKLRNVSSLNCSFSRLFCLFGIPCISICILVSSFLFLQKVQWVFGGDPTESVDHFWEYCPMTFMTFLKCLYDI